MAIHKRGLFCGTGVVAFLGLSAMWLESAPQERETAKRAVGETPTVRRQVPFPRFTDSPSRKTEGMTARPRPASPPAKSLAVGETIRTHEGERQRLVLPDASILYVNEKTELKLDADRRLSLSAGEIFLEAAPAASGPPRTWLVCTAGREISAVGAKLIVQQDAAGANVVAVRGRVTIDARNLESEKRRNGEGQVPVAGSPSRPVAVSLEAGRQIALPANRISSAPRASYLLHWIKELMVAAEAPLVPPSKHAGGDLVALDPSGHEQALSLRKYHIDVHIEDGFARTTIDQTYFNEAPQRLEGTFYFPLPPDASLSRLAMYVDGTLMEGGMAERECPADLRIDCGPPEGPGPARVGGRQHLQNARFSAGRATGQANHSQLQPTAV